MKQTNVDFVWAAQQLLDSIGTPKTTMRKGRVADLLKKIYETGYKDCIRHGDVVRDLSHVWGLSDGN